MNQNLRLELGYYEVVKIIGRQLSKIDVLRYFCATANFKLNHFKNYKSATIECESALKFVKGKSLKVTFDGKQLSIF